MSKLTDEQRRALQLLGPEARTVTGDNAQGI
jgi:hypothetical protein